MKNDFGLRFGILCENPELYAWEISCLQTLLESRIGKLEFVLVINESRKKVNYFSKNSLFSLNFLYRRLWIDKKARSSRKESIFSVLLKLFPNNSSVQKVYYLNEPASEIKDCKLDFILFFGDVDKQVKEIVAHHLNDISKFGVWRYRHGIQGRGEIACFWEIFHKMPKTEAALERIMPDSTKQVLYQGYFKTNGSCSKNLDNVRFGTHDWCVSVCRRFLLSDEQIDSPILKENHENLSSEPTNIQMLTFFICRIFTLIRKVFYYNFYLDIWNVGVVRNTTSQMLQQKKLNSEIKWMPKHHRYSYIADPHVIYEDGSYQIFVEDYKYGEKANIAKLILSENLTMQSSNASISHIWHLSYPFLFRDDTSLYCIPESSENRQTYLYERDRGTWRYIKTILKDIPLSDSTVFFHNGYWWLLATNNDEGSNEKLYGYYTNCLRNGEWKAHPFNPLKSDISSARPAGAIFKEHNTLYRPTQDCTVTYGGAIVINRIIELSPTTFKEESVLRLEPDRDSPYPDGIHTINSINNVIVIDSKKIKFHPFYPFYRSIKWISRHRLKIDFWQRQGI